MCMKIYSYHQKKIFCVHLSFWIIYKFCKKDISLQPSGDPREQHQGEARQKHRHKFCFLFVNHSKTVIQEIYVQENQFLPTEEPQEQHQGDCVPGFSRRFIGILRFWSNIQVIGNWDNRSSYFRLVISLKSHLETCWTSWSSCYSFFRFIWSFLRIFFCQVRRTIEWKS